MNFESFEAKFVRGAFLCAFAAVFGVLPSEAGADYSWFAPGTGLSSGTWSGGANWLPRAPAGGPTATDNVVTPTSFGWINVDIAQAEVTNWTYASNVSAQRVFPNAGVNASLMVSGFLSKSGTGTLAFMDATNQFAVSVGNIFVSGGVLSMGTVAGPESGLSTFSAGSADISGGSLQLNVAGASSISGLLSLSGSGAVYLAQVSNATRSVSIGALSSASATAVVAANDSTIGAESTCTLQLTGTSGLAAYAGIIRPGTGSSSLAVVKDGESTQIFSGNSNTYNGGTTINAGTLLVNNTSGSGTGTGSVTVAGGVFGGTGFVAPTGASGIGVTAGGFIAPGDGIGTLNLNLGGTTGILDLRSGGDFRFELGAPNELIGSTMAGSSDQLVISGAAAGDVVFAANTTVDLLGTASGQGYYKLFATSADATTWTGLSLGTSTTGGSFITGGLTATNFGGSSFGSLVLADGSAGTSAGDIYLLVVPEPSLFGYVVGTSVFFLILVRTRLGNKAESDP